MSLPPHESILASFKPPHSPPSMDRELTEHEQFCMQNNQLPTKTMVELKDNSNVKIFKWWHMPSNLLTIEPRMIPISSAHSPISSQHVFFSFFVINNKLDIYHSNICVQLSKVTTLGPHTFFASWSMMKACLHTTTRVVVLVGWSPLIITNFSVHARYSYSWSVEF